MISLDDSVFNYRSISIFNFLLLLHTNQIKNNYLADLSQTH